MNFEMRIFVLSVITLSIFDKETQLIPNPSLISDFQIMTDQLVVHVTIDK